VIDVIIDDADKLADALIERLGHEAALDAIEVFAPAMPKTIDDLLSYVSDLPRKGWTYPVSRHRKKRHVLFRSEDYEMDS
tara:strand:- start:1220 stop:1459 length:240 start_codon:yes stop_codon:yes gene_type:complete